MARITLIMSKHMNIIERRRRGLGSGASRTFHLTLIGAKNDVITIKDSGGNTVGTCTFPSGATQGTIDVSGNPSELYTFTSSIAKDTTSGTSAYSKQMFLSDDALKVMPDASLYWYGNKCIELTGGWTTSNIKPFTNWTTAGTPTITDNTNSITVSLSSYPSDSRSGSFYPVNNQIDFTNYSKLHFDIIANNNEDGFCVSSSMAANYYNASDIVRSSNHSAGSHSLDLSSVTGFKYLMCYVCSYRATYDYANLTISRIWLE